MPKYFSLITIVAIALFISGCGTTTPKQDNVTSPPIIEEKNEDTTFTKLSIVSNESQATFNLNELLRGVPTHVVGTSSKIIGDVRIKTTEPAKIEVGDIKLDAQSLITDNEMRNKNIIKLILKSNEPANQFIVFHSTTVDGVPAVLTPNQSFPITILGDLTISGTTKPTTFNGTVTWQANNTLTGSATTSLTYANFGLAIPNFPFLANVDKIVELKVDLVAKKQE